LPTAYLLFNIHYIYRIHTICNGSIEKRAYSLLKLKRSNFFLIKLKMNAMYPLNNILVLCFSLLIIFGCEDKEEPPIVDDSESCSLICEQSQIMYCKEDQCLCKEKMFFTPWRHKGEFCLD